MKTRERKLLAQDLEHIKETMTNDSLVVAIHSNDTNDEIQLLLGMSDEHQLPALLATFIKYALEGKDKTHSMNALTDAILEAIELMLMDDSLGAMKLVSRLGDIYMRAIKRFDAIIDDMDDGDCGCEECEMMLTCNEPEAIKYRKEHHIPRPKKTKKGGGRNIDVK